jgi:hypothetical protein
VIEGVSTKYQRNNLSKASMGDNILLACIIQLIRNSMGNSLRLAIANDNWESVRLKLDKWEVQARVQNKFYVTKRCCGTREERVKALHLVLQRNVPLDIVQKLIEIDSTLCNVRSSEYEELPMHYAVTYHSNANTRYAVIELLATTYPSSLVACSASGKTPLHIACEKTTSLSIIELLHEKNPAACDITDCEGRTPYDLAINNTKPWHFRYRRRIRNLLHSLSKPTSIEYNTINISASSEDEESGCTTSNNYAMGACVLCWDAEADHVLIPCGHICLCTRCCEVNLPALNRSCPICKKNFGKAFRVYLAGMDC